MQVANRFKAKSAIMADITATVLYELAAPSTSDEVVAKVEAKAEAGEKVSLEEVKALKRAAAEAEKARDVAERCVKSKTVLDLPAAALYDAAAVATVGSTEIERGPARFGNTRLAICVAAPFGTPHG